MPRRRAAASAGAWPRLCSRAHPARRVVPQAERGPSHRSAMSLLPWPVAPITLLPFAPDQDHATGEFLGLVFHPARDMFLGEPTAFVDLLRLQGQWSVMMGLVNPDKLI